MPGINKYGWNISRSKQCNGDQWFSKAQLEKLIDTIDLKFDFYVQPPCIVISSWGGYDFACQMLNLNIFHSLPILYETETSYSRSFLWFITRCPEVLEIKIAINDLNIAKGQQRYIEIDIEVRKPITFSKKK